VLIKNWVGIFFLAQAKFGENVATNAQRLSVFFTGIGSPVVVSGETLADDIRVTLLDHFDQALTSDSNTLVQASCVSCQIEGQTVAQTVNGTATFSRIGVTGQVQASSLLYCQRSLMEVRSYIFRLARQQWLNLLLLE
jgi:hypothetical protein